MDTPTYISNHKALVDFYGRWPMFHDAKVIAYVPPTSQSQSIAFTIQTWQMTNKLNANANFVLEKHALVTFRFDGIFDDEMTSFDAANILFGLEFSGNVDGSFRVVLDSVMDKSGSFSARKGEVVSVIPCTPDGREG